MDTKRFFEDKTNLYAAARPMYPPDLFTYLASLTPAHEAAWDCATGNGQAAVGLATHFAHVDATDVSENQLANAFEHARVHYAAHPAEKVPFDDCTFDLINVAQALHWFDLEQFWTEVKRVAKPEAVVACYCYAWPTVTPAIDQLVEDLVKAPIHEYWAPNNRMCWNGYADVDFPVERVDAPEFELKNEWSADQFTDYLHTWSAVRRCMEADGEDFFERASRELKAAWGNEPSRAVVTPLFLTVGHLQED